MNETIMSAGVACPTEYAVLRTLSYFELFSYPLTAEEVWWYLHQSPGARKPEASQSEIRDTLDALVAQERIFSFQGFYQTNRHPDWAKDRMDCNRRADQLMPMARRMARLISAFPFIQAVFVSGSLSKNCMRPDSDIDFFMITTPGRLWLTRTLLVLFKKVFLFNSHKYFCVNYFIDTDHLNIEEQNLYTATEIVTLLPLYGREGYLSFCAANAWAWKYLPNAVGRDTGSIPPYRIGFVKKGLERLLGGRFGTWLDEQFMQITLKYWRRKFSHFDQAIFDTALKSRRYVSKHHPLNFQKKVLDAFEQKIGSLWP
jgi:hypothetical protein